MSNEYRLLEPGEVFEHGDEYLSSDCETWVKIDASLGYQYKKEEFIACRRKQPKILTAEDLYCLYEMDDISLDELIEKSIKSGKLELYYQGGYKELVELIGKRISLLEQDGRITPLDVEIKKAFENIQKPE